MEFVDKLKSWSQIGACKDEKANADLLIYKKHAKVSTYVLFVDLNAQKISKRIKARTVEGAYHAKSI